MRRFAVPLAILVLVAVLPSLGAEPDARLKGAFRKPAQNGWTFVHLEGKPFDIGYQHGIPVGPGDRGRGKVVVLEQTREGKKDWKFFRNAARDMMWPHIEPEYREELQGISEGLQARGVKAGPLGCGGA